MDYRSGRGQKIGENLGGVFLILFGFDFLEVFFGQVGEKHGRKNHFGGVSIGSGARKINLLLSAGKGDVEEAAFIGVFVFFGGVGVDDTGG